MKLTPNLEKCNPLYVYQYFFTDYAQRRMQDSALVTGVPHTNLGILKEFPVMFPPLNLQNQFAAIVAAHEQTRRQQEEAARQGDHLFQTLLHRAFRGELWLRLGV
jgi:type I restriction enzyme, S subunit